MRWPWCTTVRPSTAIAARGDGAERNRPPPALRLLVDGHDAQRRHGALAGGVSRDLPGDAVPQPIGRLPADERHHRGHLAVLSDLGPSARALLEVLLDLLAFVVIHRVECVGAEQVVHLGGRQPSVHDSPPVPMSTSVERIRLRPDRMRLFTVPSGSRKSAATSR